MTRLCSISLILVLQFSIAIIHLNISILISVLKNKTMTTWLSSISLILVLKLSIMIIHVNISLLIAILKYSTTMTRLGRVSLISVLKFSIVIIHINISVLILVLKYKMAITTLSCISLIFQYWFQDLKTKRWSQDLALYHKFVTNIRYCDYPWKYYSIDFSTEKQLDERMTQFYITNFGTKI